MNVPTNISRRRILKGVAISPLCAAVNLTALASQPSTVTFVLVHGAWHGGWCWKKVTPLLRAAGYPVFTPTLTGLGERSHLISPAVDLTMHIQDIAAVIDYEDLHDVVLVGHSYAGMVITGVAEAAAGRLAQLIYLDAFLPENGKSVIDYTRPYTETPATREDGWRIPVSGVDSRFGVTDESDITWMQKRLGDQPYKTLTEPIRISNGTTRSVQRSFIQCTKAPFFAEAAERAKKNGFRFRELLTGGHDVMITKPELLATLLLELAHSA